MRKKLIPIFVLVIIIISTSLAGCADFFIPIKDLDTSDLDIPKNGQNSSTNTDVDNMNNIGYIPSNEVDSYTYSINDETLVYSDEVQLSTESLGYDTTDVVTLVEKSVVTITIGETDNKKYESQGSGVIFASGTQVNTKTNSSIEVLFIMTCAHVLTNPHDTTVRLNHSKPNNKKKAVLVGGSEQHDIAIIVIDKPADSTEYTIAKLRESKELVPFKVGEVILAIGTPIGLDFSVTKGIISGEREIKLDATTKYVLQIDAAVNPGNSGGPLFDRWGRLCGIVVAKNVGTNIDAIGYAIKIVDQDREENGEQVLDAISVAKQLIANAGTTPYIFGFLDGINNKATLGITVAEQTDRISGKSKVFVQSISSYGSVAWSNAQSSDTMKQITGVTDTFSNGEQLLEIDGIKILALTDISNGLKEKKVGDTLVIKFSYLFESVVSITLIPNIFGNTPRKVSQTSQN